MLVGSKNIINISSLCNSFLNVISKTQDLQKNKNKKNTELSYLIIRLL